MQNFVLKLLESKMKKKINKIGEQRQKLRESKSRSKIPTVAVVGYTNCGKTSLIKALTGKCLFCKKKIRAYIKLLRARIFK